MKRVSNCLSDSRSWAKTRSKSVRFFLGAAPKSQNSFQILPDPSGKDFYFFAQTPSHVGQVDYKPKITYDITQPLNYLRVVSPLPDEAPTRTTLVPARPS